MLNYQREIRKTHEHFHMMTFWHVDHVVISSKSPGAGGAVWLQCGGHLVAWHFLGSQTPVQSKSWICYDLMNFFG